MFYVIFYVQCLMVLAYMLCYSSPQLLLKDEKVVCLVYDLSSLMCVLGVFQGSEVSISPVGAACRIIMDSVSIPPINQSKAINRFS